MSMKTEGYISDRTELAVRAISEKLAPTCVNCPNAKLFISEMQDLYRDAHNVKINVRCDKMGIQGNVCPDGGDPREKYAKDIGMMRNLSEEQVAFRIVLENYMMGDSKRSDIAKIVKSREYLDLINEKVKGIKSELDDKLHIMNEAIAYVSHHIDNTIPILWVGDYQWDNMSEALDEYYSDHESEYREKLELSSGMCSPTVYMKNHFEEDFQRPFGVLVDREVANGSSGTNLGEMIKIPEEFLGTIDPEELYEDWGSFG